MIELKSDFPVTDEACKTATGKTLSEWAQAIAANPAIADKQRDAIYWISEQVGRTAADVWWATTIWVEYERQIGRTNKDGMPEEYHLCSTKSITAPVDKVRARIGEELPNITRVRDGKDTRASWRTPGVDADTLIEVAFAPSGTKTGVTLNHKRIPTREEADAMRAYWSAKLATIKAELEG